MNTKQIECILEVAKTLNFNRAAENLCISQPALSYQIQSAEDEIGFKIFNRLTRGVSLTYAGKDFCDSMDKIQKELFQAIEHGQNINRKYSDSITIGLPIRSAIFYLPDAIKTFSIKYPNIFIQPVFKFDNRLNSFLNKDCDIFFSLEDEIKNTPNIETFHLYTSKTYLIVKKNDKLAHKTIINLADLKDRTLIVGGKAPKYLKILQQKIIEKTNIDYLNSPDHGATLLSIASEKGVCLSPGFLNDHNNEFVWIPYEESVTYECVLSIHEYEKRKIVYEFIKLLQSYYENLNENL